MRAMGRPALPSACSPVQAPGQCHFGMARSLRPGVGPAGVRNLCVHLGFAFFMDSLGAGCKKTLSVFPLVYAGSGPPLAMGHRLLHTTSSFGLALLDSARCASVARPSGTSVPMGFCRFNRLPCKAIGVKTLQALARRRVSRECDLGEQPQGSSGRLS